MMQKILIVDFGSQYTQLIARRVREMHVYSEIVPFNAFSQSMLDADVMGVILSGSPCSVRQNDAPSVDLTHIRGTLPLLGICYGAQYLASAEGGTVEKSLTREYGRAALNVLSAGDPLMKGLWSDSTVWMSHGDTIMSVPDGIEVIASTQDVSVAAFRIRGESTWGLQFHPEVHHSEQGAVLLRNFVIGVCGCKGDWTPENFITRTVSELRDRLGDDEVVMALSGGVDSTVAAVLLHRAIGARLHCIFVDSGLMRKAEAAKVLKSYGGMGLNVRGVDASDRFLNDLSGVTDPEQKRKIIGRDFVEVFSEEASGLSGVRWLGQGTIYPDVVESAKVNGTATVIKSHHNVGGLPEKMSLKLVEPLRLLFKDEVRNVGVQLGIDPMLIWRHPFPGPGLGIRIVGEVTPEKVRVLQEVDDIYISILREEGWYDKIWQAGAILLPVKSVGVMGDERTYEWCVALRAVTSVDGMTADWARIPYEILARLSNEIINKVRGVNRVVYDISSKPPATIEWE